MKNSKKVDLKPKTPRALDEIKRELQQVLFNIGGAEYQVKVQKAEVERLCQEAYKLNLEGAERTKLDEAAKASEVKTNE